MATIEDLVKQFSKLSRHERLEVVRDVRTRRFIKPKKSAVRRKNTVGKPAKTKNLKVIANSLSDKDKRALIAKIMEGLKCKS